ncbi:MAG: hypothetical protein HC936_15205, partial [Leptolyngbyaceae cyanobacterium SU_3_3]|nr:hypothetical protein [Leptolyngbyaceae cyanobacterium SU_3_3]
MSNFNESQQPIRVAHLQVQSDLDEVDRVLQWFEQFYAVLSESLWMQAKLVMVEGLTNAVRHAHENLPRSTPIDLEVRVSFRSTRDF